MRVLLFQLDCESQRITKVNHNRNERIQRMAKTNIWMPFYIGDYLADTTGLSTEQHGAYLLLIFAYWTNRGPLPDDDDELAQITRLDKKTWIKHRPRLAKFFQITNAPSIAQAMPRNATAQASFWHHPRIDKEMHRVSLNSVSNSQKAKKAAKARWSDAPSNAPECQPQPQPDIVQKEKGRKVVEHVAPPELAPGREIRPNSPELAYAQAVFVKVNEREKIDPEFKPYTAEEVRQAWLWFEQHKDTVTGEWIQPSTTGRKSIGDWISALMSQIGHMRNLYANSKRNTGTTQRGEDTRDHGKGF
jgi:uncharacterized protein YdaU (DUF1376 family)